MQRDRNKTRAHIVHYIDVLRGEVEGELIFRLRYQLADGEFRDIAGKRGSSSATQRDVDVKGNLWKSVQAGRDKETGSVEIFANDYIFNLDEGRPPNLPPPPLTAIMEFIDKRKLKPSPPMTKVQLAVLIQKSIRRLGIAPRHVLLSAWNAATKAIDKSIDKQIKNLASDLGGVLNG